jgi:hypothetical protein
VLRRSAEHRLVSGGDHHLSWHGFIFPDHVPALNAPFSQLTGIPVDPSGNPVVAQRDDCRVARVRMDTKIVEVLAGNGICSVISGDGGPAISAALNAPAGVVYDPKGNLYISDGAQARTVSPDGIITSFASRNIGGYSGDGGPALAAQLSGTGVGLASDTAGNIYIADSYNHRSRRVALDGMITTIAGTVQAGFSGDGGPATSAQFKSPEGIAADAAGNVFVGDSSANVVRKISTTGIITTFAGNGSGDGKPAAQASIGFPVGMAVSTAGDVYISQFFDSVVRNEIRNREMRNR